MTRFLKAVRVGWPLVFNGPLLFCPACEINTTIAVSTGNPPKFTLRGSGVLFHFVVYELDVENKALPQNGQDTPPAKAIWRIEVPAGAQPADIDSMSPFEYGHPPAGFVQSIPASGTAPPALTEGKVYGATAYVNGAAGGTIKFTVSHRQTVVSGN